MDNDTTAKLIVACEVGSLIDVRLIIEWRKSDKNPLPNTVGYSRLMYAACWGGHLSIVKYLYELGANVNVGYNGIPPLYIACMYCHIDVVRYLISLPDIDLDLRDDN